MSVPFHVLYLPVRTFENDGGVLHNQCYRPDRQFLSMRRALFEETRSQFLLNMFCTLLAVGQFTLVAFTCLFRLPPTFDPF